MARLWVALFWASLALLGAALAGAPALQLAAAAPPPALRRPLGGRPVPASRVAPPRAGLRDVALPARPTPATPGQGLSARRLAATLLARYFTALVSVAATFAGVFLVAWQRWHAGPRTCDLSTPVSFLSVTSARATPSPQRRPSELRLLTEDSLALGEDEFFPDSPLKRPPKKFIAKPFAYHEVITLRIDNLTNLGAGVGRLDDWVVFVPFTLPGELVRARVFRNHKRFSEADLVEVMEPSPDRVLPRCAVYATCAGCQYQHLSYEQQLEWKRNQVVELLDHMADIKDVPVAPAIPSPRQYGYRAKITPHFFRPKPEGQGPREVGFLQAGTRGRLVDVEQCPIATPEINVKYQEVREMVRHDRTRYKKGGTLLMRHKSPDTVTSDPCEVCEERLGPLVFQYPARDFFQTNPFILPAFVEHVKQQAVGLGASFLVDAYCGCGLFALALADAFEAVAGVEVTESSVRWAHHNTELNAVPNVTFHLGSAESIFAKVTFPPAHTALVIDPPRKGCSEEFLDQVMRFGPVGLVYVSCNPATQMRDLVRLRAGGYVVTHVQPVDLFPQTRHLECVVTCRRVMPADPPAP